MYFKKLEIIGFKSFADRTTLLFEPGITAIVGPNGCGKSNIFDSIRWVLGEQSIKSLRGSKMEDVIFNGTQEKAPLSLAEVSLTFSNEARFLPVDCDDVTITRRIFRSGESEYLLNKTQVRLKDINELLSGTGIGAESYSLVEQGKIDLLLSSRPEDRRLVFDEAAGVTKYKSKKREALRKLEDAENNLLRVNDIIVEVKRQINSLDRQVNKARRYKEIFENLKSLEVKFSRFQMKELKEEFNNLFSKIEGLKNSEAEKSKELANLNVSIHELRLSIQTKEEEISKKKDNEYSLISLFDKDTEIIKMNQERLRELDLRIASLGDRRIKVSSRIDSSREKFDNLNDEFTNLASSEGEKDAELKEKQVALDALAQAINNAHAAIAEAKKQILTIAQEEAILKNESSQLVGKIASFSSRRKRLIMEKEKVVSEKDSLDSEIVLKESEINTFNATIADLRNKESDLKCSLQASKGKLENFEESVKKLENEKLSLESQLEFLEKLKLRYEDIPEVLDGVIIVDRLPEGDLSGILSKVKEITQTSDGKYRIACEIKPIPLDTQKIKDKINSIVGEITDISLKVESEKNNIKDIELDSEQNASILHQKEVDLNGMIENLKSSTLQCDKLIQELEVIGLEFSETVSELDNLQKKEEEFKNNIMALEQKRQNNENAMAQANNQINVNVNLKEELSIAIATLSTEISSLDERRLALSNSLKLMQETIDSDTVNLESIKHEDCASKDKIADFKKQNEDLETEIAETKIKKEGLSVDLDNLKSDLGNLLEEQKVREEKVSFFHNEIDQLKSSIYDLSMQDKEIEFKESTIKERILQAYKVNLDEEDAIDEEIDREAMYSEIEQQKMRIDKMGTVNLVAIEEHEELKQRHEFLTNQQNDLLSAKESLKDAISKINKTTKQLFLDTFEKVSIEFKTYFRMLFGGGDAQLFLIDESDVLESGIEIVASPPGKKLQNIMLLSGGEKSLSAIALIFAVFKVKPSPFCVLDEIDAALDESNVDRFNHILKDFTSTSQFLMITHNKKTITAANVMYGITMQERGVSKIVSAKLREETRTLPNKEVSGVKVSD